MKRLSLLALALASTAFAAASGTTLILNGTAIDPGTGKVMPNAVITIDRDHITAIKENSSDTPKKGDVVLDARGKFILPATSIPTSISSNPAGSSLGRTAPT